MTNFKNNAKCLGCGGELVFSGTHQALFCANCGRVHNFEKKNKIIKLAYNSEMINSRINNAENKSTNKNEIQVNKTIDGNNVQNNELIGENEENLNENNANLQEKTPEKTDKKTVKTTTNCPNCGAKFQQNAQNITLSCPYCGTKFVKNNEEFSGLKPNNIIPFAFDKQKAIEFYKQNVKHKWFLPNKFKKNPNVDTVSGTYISCFSFDSFTISTYSGVLVETDRTYHNGEWHEHSSTKRISGTKKMQFNDVIVESSRITNQKSFDEIKPFIIDDKTCFEYNKNFLRGYNVETYDNHPTNCKKISEELMKVQIKNEILRGYSYDRVQYFNLSTTFENNKFSYILLPVYFINFKYKNKNYQTYLNGQTGRIGNNLPKSATKITFTVLLGVLFFLLIFLLPLLLN